MTIKKVLIPFVAFVIAVATIFGFSSRAVFALSNSQMVASAKESADKKDSKELTINAKSALLMDYSSGTVVFSANEKQHLPIASMVKIMTLLLTFEEIEKGSLGYDTMIVASQNATSMGGSQAFLDTNASYRADELIKSIVVASANDSCVAIGEHISGDITSFVDRMNERAAQLGMQDTNFVNCTGLPEENQYSCAYDVALMTRQLINHNDFFNFSKVWMFDFTHPSGRITELSNTNKLIRAYEGCDGGKTGFTQEAMYCLSATARRGSTRLISVVMGAQTSKERNAQNAKLFNYGFANYETRQLVVKDIPLENECVVVGGKEKSVRVAPSSDFYTFIKKGVKPEVSFEFDIFSAKAPIISGQKLGEMKVIVDGETKSIIDLSAISEVGKMTFMDALDDCIAAW